MCVETNSRLIILPNVYIYIVEIGDGFQLLDVNEMTTNLTVHTSTILENAALIIKAH